ncbi:hypothetical protein DIPPA_01637 [Diplonema papillatum]|nr:hypothetical protein DIPPA_01637 [Diplonema papillatum]
MGKLYYNRLSQPCRSVLWFLGFTGIEFEKHEVNISARENETPEFIKLNPLGQLPVWVEDDFVLTESSAILQYLATADLRACPSEAGKIAEYIARHHSLVRQLSSDCFVPALLAPDSEHASVAKAKFEDVADTVNLFEADLSKHRFVVGDKLTVCDFLFACEVDQLHCFGLLENYPKIQEYLRRICEVQGYKDVWTPFVQALVELKVLTQVPPQF